MAGKEKTVVQLNGEINLKADKAKSDMTELKRLLNEFSNKTIEVKAQTRSARMSIDNLGTRIAHTFGKENEVKLNVGDASRKLDSLISKLGSLKNYGKITLSLDAHGVPSTLQSIRNDLIAITGKKSISLNANTAQVKSQLGSLAKDINNIKNVSFNVSVKNNADIKGIDTFTKDMSKLAGLKKDIEFGIQVKTVQNSLDRVRQVSNVLANLKNNNSIQFTETGLRPILGKLKSMELYLRSIKQNSNIKIEAKSAKDSPKLKVEADQSDLFAVEKRLAIIKAMIKQINKMSLKVEGRVNTRNSGSGSSGGRNGGGSELRGGWYNSSFFTQFIHFVGRSSKGFGSFGEATADVLAKMQTFGGALGTLGTAGAIVGAGIASVAASGALVVGAFNSVTGAVTLFGNILGQIGTTIYNVLKPGIELYIQQTSAMFSMTASLKSNAKYFEDTGSSGKSLSSSEARGLSRDIITRATLDAEMSAFSLEELLRSLQGTLPILLSKGFSLDQAYDINKGVAGVAKQIQLTPSQILQETRDLAQGSITSRGSQVANALGISNADIAKYEGNADELFNYLMNKFKEYSELLSQYENTALGRWQQLQERWQSVTRTMVDGMADQFQSIFEELINLTGNWVDSAGNKLNAITGKWQDNEGNSYNKEKNRFEDENGNEVVKSAEALQNVGKGAVFNLSEPLQKASEILKELVEFSTNLVANFVEYVQEATNGEEPLNVMRDVIEAIEILFVLILEKVVDFCEYLVRADEDGNSLFVTLYNGAGMFFDMLGSIYDKTKLITLEIQKWAGLIEAALTTLGIGILTGGVGTVAGGAIKLGSKAIKPLGKSIGKATESGIGKNIKDGLSSGLSNITERWSGLSKTEKGVGVGATGLGVGSFIFDELFGESDEDKLNAEIAKVEAEVANREKNGFKKINSFEELRDSFGDSEASKKLKERQLQLQKERENLANDPSTDPSKVKGESSSSKDAKEANREAQKAMAVNIQELKDGLKDFITDLKDTLAKNKIAFDEGFMSVREYYTQKADIERQEAQARLNEVLAEKDEIEKTPFNSADEQRKELSRLNREISQYTRELNKAVKGQQEVANVFEQSKNEFKNMVMASDSILNSRNTVKPINGPLNAENTAGMSHTEMLYRLFTTTGGMNDAMAKGILASLMGESGRELRTDLVGDNGTSFGIAQWHNSRWKQGLVGFSSENNSDILHPLTQGSYLLQELNTTEARNWALVLDYFNKNGQTADAMTYAFTKYIERPADKEGQGIARQQNIAHVIADLALANNRQSQPQAIPSQYNRYGIDTRYTDVDHTLRPNEIAHDLGNLKPYVKELHNAIAREYFEATGQKLSINIATAGDHPSNASAWGHANGYKIDYDHTGVDFDTLGNILSKWGVAASFEAGNHIDASFGEGRVGSGKYLTNYKTGTDAFDKYSNGSLASTRLNAPNTMEISSEALNAVKEYQKRLREIIVDNESYLFDQYSKQLDALAAQMNEEINGKEVAGFEGSEKDSMIQQIKVKYQRKMSEVIVSATEKTIDYNLAKIEDDFDIMLKEAKVGRRAVSDIGGRVGKVLNYFWNTSGDSGGADSGVWGIFIYLERLMQQASEQLKTGNTQAYQQIMNKVRTLKSKSFEFLNKWANSIESIFDGASDIFNSSNKFTSLQKEFGSRELNAMKGQQMYGVYSQVEAELTKLVDKQKELYETMNASGNFDKAKEAYRDLIELESQLWDTKSAKEKMRMLAEDYPNYLRDLKKTAKQALEDGLVTFLTDGVNEAESLGEALRNLAVSILKEIQQMSAKWLVKSMMNQWFEGYDVSDPSTLSIDSTGIQIAGQLTTAGQAVIDALMGTATGIRSVTGIGSVRVGGGTAPGAIATGTVYSGTNYQLPALQNSAFGTAVSTRTNYTLPALQNSKFGANGGKGVMAGIDSANTGLNTFATTLSSTTTGAVTPFSDALTKTAQDASSAVASSSVDAGAQQLGQSLQTASVTIDTQAAQLQTPITTLATNLQLLATNAQNATTALGSISSSLSVSGHADGGLIRGAGTGTSDSIPSMLSNGEFVIKASSVKRYGTNFLNSVNNGTFTKINPKVAHFAQGGLVSHLAQEQTARGISNFGKDISNNISNTANISVALVRDEQEGMKQLLRSPEGQRIMLDFSRKYASVTRRF